MTTGKVNILSKKKAFYCRMIAPFSVKESTFGILNDAVSKPVLESTKVSLVPYYAWSNRGDSEMSVFLSIIWK